MGEGINWELIGKKLGAVVNDEFEEKFIGEVDSFNCENDEG